GKAYLNHVAITDEPASLGTEQLSFSHNGEQGHIFTSEEPIEINLEQLESDEELIAKVKQRPSLFKRFFTPQSEQDTDDMSAEDKAALKELQEKFSQLEQQIAGFNTGGETQGDEETPDYEAQFNTLQKQFNEQKNKLDEQEDKLKGYSKLESDFNELSTNFKDAMKDQTPEPDRQTGGSDTTFTGF
ncbi:MAG: GPO family capsid scaffolding protein, partial [Marinomonas atlantica]|nr:GPO family capsid scaffolding protein [Marinomonas atlantica]